MPAVNPGSEDRRPEDTSAGRTDATQAGRSADRAQEEATRAQASAATATRQAERAEQTRHSVHTVSGDRAPRQFGSWSVLWIVGGLIVVVIALVLLWPMFSGSSTASTQEEKPMTRSEMMQLITEAQKQQAPQPVVVAQPNQGVMYTQLEEEIRVKEKALALLNPNCPKDRPAYDALAANIASLRAQMSDLRSNLSVSSPSRLPRYHGNGASLRDFELLSGEAEFRDAATAAKRYDADIEKAKLIRRVIDDKHQQSQFTQERILRELEAQRQEKTPQSHSHTHSHQHVYPTTTVRVQPVTYNCYP